jgi:type I restriction enzyme M protein
VNGEDSAFAKHMSDAIFMIPKAAVLDRVVNMIDKIDMNDRDTKGDLYEYMLSKLQNSGTNGQFRTPRHIIKMMVHMTKPKLGGVAGGDTICDPASGTCGFLMAAEEYVRQRFEQELLKPANSTHFHNSMFNAYDFDQHMLRIGAMNLMLHGVEQPTVEYSDSLSDHGDNNISDKYSLILANPPFKGSVAFDELSPDLLSALGKTPKKAAAKKDEKDDEGNTKQKKPPSEKTELLFLALILRMLQPGGRAAVIVPDGVLYRWNNNEDEQQRKRTEQSFYVPLDEIVKNDYDLSINRYKEVVYEEVTYDEPKVIIKRIKALQAAMDKEICELEGML